MSRKRKCVCCGEEIEGNEPSIPYKGRYAHEKCFNVAIKTLQKDKKDKLSKKEEAKRAKKTKPKAELKDALSEEEYQDKKQFYQYIKSLLETEELPVKIYAITNDNIKKYNFTFKGMLQTLVYLNEILCKNLSGDIVGIIPYYYTEAEKYYQKVEEVKEINKEKDLSGMYAVRTVQVRPKKNLSNQIDITSIGNEDVL